MERDREWRRGGDRDDPRRARRKRAPKREKKRGPRPKSSRSHSSARRGHKGHNNVEHDTHSWLVKHRDPVKIYAAARRHPKTGDCTSYRSLPRAPFRKRVLRHKHSLLYIYTAALISCEAPTRPLHFLCRYVPLLFFAGVSSACVCARAPFTSLC